MYLTTQPVVDRLIAEYRLDHGPDADEAVALRRQVADLRDEVDYLNERHCTCGAE
jgi:hypothetical protein